LLILENLGDRISPLGEQLSVSRQLSKLDSSSILAVRDDDIGESRRRL